MKKMTLMVLIAVFVITGVFAAGTKEKIVEKEIAPTLTKDGRIEVMFWCTYTGDSSDFFDKIISEFNTSQSKYFVVKERNGNYYDQLAKMQATDRENLPALCNSSSETVGSYLYSGVVKMVQDFMDADPSYKTNLYGNLVPTYGLNERLIGYPLGQSLSGFFYNADVFKAAGIDPYSLRSMDAIYEAAGRIVEGGFAKYGIAEEHSGIWANYAFAREGYYCTDNENGTTGLPTRCLYDDNSNGFADIVERYYTSWANLASKGYVFPFGAKIKDDIIPALGRGELAMVVTTNSYRANVNDAAKAYGSTYGFVPMFSVTEKGKQTGYCASGNGFFIVDNGCKEEQLGAWEFIKYFTSPSVQLRWNKMTGYLPLYDEIYNSGEYQEFINDPENAYIKVLIHELQQADSSAFYAFTATNNVYSPAGATCLEAVMSGVPVKKAIAEMCATINESFQLYNATNR